MCRNSSSSNGSICVWNNEFTQHVEMMMATTTEAAAAAVVRDATRLELLVCKEWWGREMGAGVKRWAFFIGYAFVRFFVHSIYFFLRAH